MDPMTEATKPLGAPLRTGLQLARRSAVGLGHAFGSGHLI